jgi:hypothetical protein
MQHLCPDNVPWVPAQDTNMTSITNPVIFAQFPASLNEDLLDYSKADDVRIYQSTIASMTPV